MDYHSILWNVSQLVFIKFYFFFNWDNNNCFSVLLIQFLVYCIMFHFYEDKAQHDLIRNLLHLFYTLTWFLFTSRSSLIAILDYSKIAFAHTGCLLAFIHDEIDEPLFLCILPPLLYIVQHYRFYTKRACGDTTNFSFIYLFIDVNQSHS